MSAATSDLPPQELRGRPGEDRCVLSPVNLGSSSSRAPLLVVVVHRSRRSLSLAAAIRCNNEATKTIKSWVGYVTRSMCGGPFRCDGSGKGCCRCCFIDESIRDPGVCISVALTDVIEPSSPPLSLLPAAAGVELDEAVGYGRGVWVAPLLAP